MRIGCLQFAPQVGDVDNNLNRADAVLNRNEPDDLDVLVLPELAFSGYNFKSLQDISPFLEPSGSGITSLWTRTVALKYDCTVITGYPEKVDPSLKWPTGPEYYNAAIVVNGDGETIANYRKNHLYFTDEKWALESTGGFSQSFYPGLGPTCIGIGMDLNPYRLYDPWHKFEFAHHVLDSESRLVVVSMAWITQEDTRSFSRMPQEPDMATLTYWISRLEPIIRAESDEEVIVVFANRTGTEDEFTYAGTSAVVGIKAGEVYLYGILGRGDKDLLVVDTDSPPYAKIVYRPLARSSTDLKPPLSHNHTPSKSGEKSEKSGQRGKDAQLLATHPVVHSDSLEPSRLTRSSFRRDDLHIAVPTTSDRTIDSRAPSIQTPTAPSPTPHSMRPRLPIPPAPSMTQRYLESNASDPFFGMSAAGAPGFILGGEVRIEASCPPSATSTTYASESHFSESSVESPQIYWAPHAQVPQGLKPFSTVPGSSDIHPGVESGPGLSKAEDVELEKRLSIRSDVSVWNNVQGRPRSVNAIPNALHYQAPMATKELKDVFIPSKPDNTTTKSGSLPQRPSSPKSRHASRSRGIERSNSVAGMCSDLSAVQRKLEDVALRAESAQTIQSRCNTPLEGIESSAQHESSPGITHSGGYTTATPSNIPGRTLSRMSIPIAMDSSLWGVTRHSNEATKSASTAKLSDLPILEPFSRERVRSMSEASREKGPESAGLEPLGGGDDDQGSRGRQRQVNTGPGRMSNPPNASGEHRAIAMATNQRDIVDLSKFALIEEYPSPHCPVHGQRSRTGTQEEHLLSEVHRERRSQSSVPSRLVLSSQTSGVTSQSAHTGQQSRPSKNSRSIMSLSSTPPHKMPGAFSSPDVSATPRSEPKTPKAMKMFNLVNEEISPGAHSSVSHDNVGSGSNPSARPRSW